MNIDGRMLERLVQEMQVFADERVMFAGSPEIRRYVGQDAFHFNIQLQPLITTVDINEMSLRLAEPHGVVDLVWDGVRNSAARLRGRVLRDLLLGWKQRPLDVLDRDTPTSDAEAITISEHLGQALIAIGRGDIAERVGIQLLENFQRGS